MADEGIRLGVAGDVERNPCHGQILARRPEPADVPRGLQRGQTLAMHIPAKVDYGIRALLALAAAGTPQTAEYLAG